MRRRVLCGFSAPSLCCTAFEGARCVTPPSKFRNTFRPRVMLRALLNRKTGKQRPFATRLFRDSTKRLQTLRRIVKHRYGHPKHAARHGNREVEPLPRWHLVRAATAIGPGTQPLAIAGQPAIIVFLGLQVFGGKLPHLCAGLRLGIAVTPHAPVLLVQPSPR